MKRDIFHAIADPTRRAILVLIAAQAMTPNALAEHFDLTRQGVSKHLSVLAQCELISHKQYGREIYYQINAKQMKKVADFIEPFRKMWDDRFNKLEAIMKKHKPKK